MFVITNVSNNPLACSDGKRLSSGDSRKMKTLGDKEKKYESLGFFSIYEEVKEESPKPAEKTDGGKK